jgi:hypothetical protein
VNLTNLVRLTGDDAGEILTLQRAAYVKADPSGQL